MPCGDGTGPWWMKEKNWRHGKSICGGISWRYRQRSPIVEPTTLTKEEQKKTLEEDLQEIEKEKQAIEKRLKEIEE